MPPGYRSAGRTSGVGGLNVDDDGPGPVETLSRRHVGPDQAVDPDFGAVAARRVPTRTGDGLLRRTGSSLGRLRNGPDLRVAGRRDGVAQGRPRPRVGRAH